MAEELKLTTPDTMPTSGRQGTRSGVRGAAAQMLAACCFRVLLLVCSSDGICLWCDLPMGYGETSLCAWRLLAEPV